LLLQKSTIQLLRFPFSVFLLPVYLFAISFLPTIDWGKAFSVFVLLHLLVYPASNGYNSYMDRDEASIGGIEKPMPPTRQLFWATIFLDTMALLLAEYIGGLCYWFVLVYIGFSRLYSYRGIRLKRYPIVGFITVVINQGATVFALVYMAVSKEKPNHIPYDGLAISTLLIGGFYPITQIYQYEQDKADGVTTISMLLGKRGTFMFCALLYSISFGLLFLHYYKLQQLRNFYVVQALFAPVIGYFLYWFVLVWKDEANANFTYTMRMNWLASVCTNLAFTLLICLQHYK
jgi:1,4-dihydroxy-2-naphthoate octaprenyltransferase